MSNQFNQCSVLSSRPEPKATTLARAPERFWRRVSKSDSCWTWNGATNGVGYGIFTVGYRRILAHRFSWQLHTGEECEAPVLRHTCDNPLCVRPEHLVPGTQKDNIQDALSRQRLRTGDRVTWARLKESDVRSIRSAYQRGVYGFIRVGRDYGVSASTIEHIINGKSWKGVN